MVLLLMILYVGTALGTMETNMELGEYNLTIDDCKMCMIQRTANAVKSKSAFIHNPNGTVDISFDTTYSKSIGPLSVHFKLSYMADGKIKKVFFEKEFENMCKSSITQGFMKAYIKPFLNENCYIRAGHWVDRIYDLGDKIRIVFGKKFIYGNYYLRIIAYCQKIVTSCLDFKISVKSL